VNWRNKTILVTGATGFIGGRICERLFQEGVVHTRALVHNIQHAPRIARLPIELFPGDLLDRESLTRALSGSQLVIHCGLGIGRGIVGGTTNLLQAAESAGVERFVHMSTAAVYGLTPPPGSESEDAPLRRTGDAYCDNKARAERVVAGFVRRGVPAVILRPSIVYGPYSAWSTRLVEALRQQRLSLIDNGAGACNTTYVDNLVDAIFLTLENDRAIGETFFITDGEPNTWGDFIRAHANMMNPKPSLPTITTQEVITRYREEPGLWAGSFKEARRLLLSHEFRLMILNIPLVKQTFAPLWRTIESMPPTRKQRLRSFLGNGKRPHETANNTFIPNEVDFATQTGTVFFAIDKARRILGYEPRVDFCHGIKLVEQWLRFASFL
jgi:nucleoside-diphosphate-sugar epimerase